MKKFLFFVLIFHVVNSQTATKLKLADTERFCETAVALLSQDSPEIVVYRGETSGPDELANIHFTGVTPDEVYQAYLTGPVEPVIDLAFNVGSQLGVGQDGKFIRVINVVTPMGVDATMTLHDLGGNSSEVVTDISIEASDPAKLGIPDLPAALARAGLSLMGADRIRIRGTVRQTFVNDEEGGGLFHEEWLRPLTVSAVLVPGFEVKAPSVLNSFVQGISNQFLPITDAHGVRNFAKLIKAHRGLPTVLTLGERLTQTEANGGFGVDRKFFIPGATLKMLKRVIPEITIIGKDGLAGEEADVSEQVEGDGTHVAEGFKPGNFLEQAVEPSTTITMNVETQNHGQGAVLIHNVDSGGVNGSSTLTAWDGSFDGQKGLVVEEKGQYTPNVPGLKLITSTGGSKIVSLFLAKIHLKTYHIEAITRALADVLPKQKFKR